MLILFWSEITIYLDDDMIFLSGSTTYINSSMTCLNVVNSSLKLWREILSWEKVCPSSLRSPVYRFSILFIRSYLHQKQIVRFIVLFGA